MRQEDIYYPVIRGGDPRKLSDIIKDGLGIETEYDYDALLVLAMYASALTASEVLLLCPGLSKAALLKHLSRLKKYGYITTLPFTASRAVSHGGKKTRVRKNVSFDSARQYFGLTRKGIKHLKEIGIDTTDAFVVSKELSMQHTYATGYNLAELLKLPLPSPVKWLKESAFYYDRGSDETLSGVYRTDAECIIKGDTGRIFMHFEQDMCTEKTSVLIEKCDHYIHGDLMDRREDVLIFSIWNEMQGYGARQGAFSSSYLKNLCDTLLTCGAGNASILKGHGEFWPDQKGLGKLIDTYSADYGEDGLTPSVLKDIISRLDSGCEPVYRALLNKNHSDGAFKRLYSFVREAAGFDKVPGTKVEEPNLYVLISSLLCLNAYWGNQILFIPTPLLARKVPFIAPMIYSDIAHLIGASVSKYFERLVFRTDHTGTLFKTLDIGGFSGESYPVCLRNEFRYRKNGTEGMLCVEFMSIDAGAWFRAMLFDRYVESIRQNGGAEKPVTLVLVFDDVSQRDKYFKTSPYCHRGAFGLDYSGFNIVYLYTSELGEPEVLLKSIAYVDKTEGEVVDTNLLNIG